MIEEQSEVLAPQWLTNLSPASMSGEPVPLQHILKDSLYYPASGFDGDPVRYLGGNILSFIYVDYGHTSDEFLRALRSSEFRGYDIVSIRSVDERELVPNGWPLNLDTRREGVPLRLRDWINEPFCFWCVFERRPEFPLNHGPARFSLLYLCADGVASFQALYIANCLAPKAIAIIQPGTGFGGNWTDFTASEQIMSSTVRGNPYGQPALLLYGGIGPRISYQKPCWPEYPLLIRFFDEQRNRSIGLWSMQPDRKQTGSEYKYM